MYILLVYERELSKDDYSKTTTNKASRRQDSSERYRALSYCNHLAQDTDFV